MTFEQFDPKKTTTLEKPKKVIEKQGNNYSNQKHLIQSFLSLDEKTERIVKVGFVSL